MLAAGRVSVSISSYIYIYIIFLDNHWKVCILTSSPRYVEKSMPKLTGPHLSFIGGWFWDWGTKGTVDPATWRLNKKIWIQYLWDLFIMKSIAPNPKLLLLPTKTLGVPHLLGPLILPDVQPCSWPRTTQCYCRFCPLYTRIMSIEFFEPTQSETMAVSCNFQAETCSSAWAIAWG